MTQAEKAARQLMLVEVKAGFNTVAEKMNAAAAALAVYSAEQQPLIAKFNLVVSAAVGARQVLIDAIAAADALVVESTEEGIWFNGAYLDKIGSYLSQSDQHSFKRVGDVWEDQGVGDSQLIFP